MIRNCGQFLQGSHSVLIDIRRAADSASLQEIAPLFPRSDRLSFVQTGIRSDRNGRNWFSVQPVTWSLECTSRRSESEF